MLVSSCLLSSYCILSWCLSCNSEVLAGVSHRDPRGALFQSLVFCLVVTDLNQICRNCQKGFSQHVPHGSEETSVLATLQLSERKHTRFQRFVWTLLLFEYLLLCRDPAVQYAFISNMNRTGCQLMSMRICDCLKVIILFKMLKKKPSLSFDFCTLQLANVCDFPVTGVQGALGGQECAPPSSTHEDGNQNLTFYLKFCSLAKVRRVSTVLV